MSAAAALARFAVTATPPEALMPIIAPAIADCFGCILAGADSEVALRTREAIAPLGAGTAPVFGTQADLPGPYAALVNAVAGHAWDLDDWEEPGNTHPTVVLLPALLAAADLHPADGQTLAAAYAVGTEIIMRLGEALSLDHYARGFHSTGTLGAIGAAGAVARLIGLDAAQTTHTLAIASSQASGYTVQFGSNAKPLQAGFAARAGVEAALLARVGATGQAQVLDHPRGFAGLMGDHDPSRLEAMAERLGAPWALDQYGLILKPWPSCGYTHRLMTAALELRPQLAGCLSEVAGIHAWMPDFHHAILPFHQPKSRNEALFSAPACLAQALVTGGLTLADSEAAFWQAPEVARLISLTSVTPEPARNPTLNYDPDQPDGLRITLADGTTLETTCALPLGAPGNPMSPEALADKFHAITARPAQAVHGLLDWPAAPDISLFFKEMAQ